MIASYFKRNLHKKGSYIKSYDGVKAKNLSIIKVTFIIMRIIKRKTRTVSRFSLMLQLWYPMAMKLSLDNWHSSKVNKPLTIISNGIMLNLVKSDTKFEHYHDIIWVIEIEFWAEHDKLHCIDSDPNMFKDVYLKIILNSISLK